MVNLFFLKTFVDAVKTGSLRSSALKNFVTQPAVTQHIRLLEKKLGCELFERHHKKIILTPCGKRFFECAEQILDIYAKATVSLEEIQNHSQNLIRIATIYSIGLYRLKSVITRYLELFPAVDIQLEYQPVNKVYELIAGGSLDFGFVAYPQKKTGLVAKVLAHEEMVLVQSKKSPVIDKKRIAIKELDRIPLLFFSHETPTYMAIVKLLKKNGVRPHIIHEYSNIETLKSAIELGLGCSIVPKDCVRADVERKMLEIVHLEGLELTRPIGVLYPKGRILSPTLQTFSDVLMDL